MLALLVCVSAFTGSWYSLVPSGDSWIVQQGRSGCASAKLEKQLETQGWDVLTIETWPQYDDAQQAWCAGYLEAALTQSSLWDSFRNTFNSSEPVLSAALESFILENDAWVRSNAASPSANPTYWAHVALVLAQLDGLYDGYIAYAPAEQQLSYVYFLLYQLAWDLGDIQVAVGDARTSFSSHCSSLVKPTRQGLLQSHSTWTSYTSMLRVYKHFTSRFALEIASQSVSFSSYPGSIASGDDFYITSANLVVMETTNDVFNTSLYSAVTTHTVMYWIRCVVANRMASNGTEWANVFSLYNSGTYNNQWIVVDNKLVGDVYPQQFASGTLTILEQIPGHIISQDQTDVLNAQGYWPSYNIPFYPQIRELSGFADCPGNKHQQQNWCNYANCSRALMFSEQQDGVVDMPSFKRVMRYNRWQSDPLSRRDACAAISARCDLNLPWNEK
jgi:hypothetical protein